MKHLLWTTIVFLLSLFVAEISRAQEVAPAAANSKNFKHWVKFIAPSKEELRYENISWRNQFWPAVQEAKKLGRPILLWTMNGHPLGCT